MNNLGWAICWSLKKLRCFISPCLCLESFLCLQYSFNFSRKDFNFSFQFCQKDSFCCETVLEPVRLTASFFEPPEYTVHIIISFITFYCKYLFMEGFLTVFQSPLSFNYYFNHFCIPSFLTQCLTFEKCLLMYT